MELKNLADVTTPKELADFIRVSEQTVKRALKSGALVGFKVGRDWRIEKTRAIEWLTQHNGKTEEPASVPDIATTKRKGAKILEFTSDELDAAFEALTV